MILHEKFTVLGFSSALSYWITQHYETAAGMVLSAALVITTIIIHSIKIKAARREEERKEEIHQIKISELKKVENGNNSRT